MILGTTVPLHSTVPASEEARACMLAVLDVGMAASLRLSVSMAVSLLLVETRRGEGEWLAEVAQRSAPGEVSLLVLPSM